MGLGLWGYALGTCISLTSVCVPELYIMEFKTEYTCNIHALLTTQFHQWNIDEITQSSGQVYSSYSGCYTHEKLLEMVQSAK